MSYPASQEPRAWRAVAPVGAGLILVAGLIHLFLTPEHFEEATYMGLLFFADFVGAAMAAYGIYRRYLWGWALGALVASGAYVLYIVSATVGLPGVEREPLLDPVGIAAKVVEVLFLVLCTFAFSRGFTDFRRWLVAIGVAAVLLVVVPGLALALSPPETQDVHHGADHPGSSRSVHEAEGH